MGFFHRIFSAERWSAGIAPPPAPGTLAATEPAWVCGPCGEVLAEGQAACHGDAPLKVLKSSIVLRKGKAVNAVRMP